MKVVWLCGMWSNEIGDHLKVKFNPFAQWMDGFINIARKLPSLDVHVVTPNMATNKDEEFVIDGIHYHLFKYSSGFLSNRNTLVELALTRSYVIKKNARKIIDSIKPDIVHLFGAENINYSNALIPVFGNYPTLVTFQGFIRWANKPSNIVKRFVYNVRVKDEATIYKNCDYVSFIALEDYLRREFNKMFPGKSILRLDFPLKLPKLDAYNFSKEYDIVFWGRVTENKGVEDLVKATAILAKRKSDIKVLIIGGAAVPFMERLKQVVKELGIIDNVKFAGFQNTQDDVFQKAVHAKVYCLPTYFDAVPGSICEAMALRLPVVSYPVGGIPYLNEKDECIALAKERDVQSLADNLWKVLSDSAYSDELIAKGYARISELCDNSLIEQQLLDCYNKIMKK